MIDYDKLKLAHELADKYRLSGNYIAIHAHFNEDERGIPHYWNIYTQARASIPICEGTLEDLIAYLQELTQQKPRYAIGQEVWFYTTRRGICNLIITDIDSDSTEKYLCNYVWYKENELYPTKSELIEAQIEYWTQLKIDAISGSKSCPKCGMQRVAEGMCWEIGCDYKECQHESDGKYYVESALGNAAFQTLAGANKSMTTGGVQYKCLKCGEFYR